MLAGQPTPPGLRRHRRAALRLDDLELECARAAGDARLLTWHQRPDRDIVNAADRAGAADVEAAIVDRCPRARPRLERAHLSVDLDRRPAPVDPAVRARERMDVGRGAIVLRLGLDLATRPLLEDRRNDLRGEVGEPRFELGRRLSSRERHGPALDDRPGIELLGHDHQRHAALGVAGKDRPRHGCRSPVARQERRVDVEGRPPPEPQQVGWHDLAVGHEDHAVRVESLELLAGDIGAQARGRQYRDAALACGNRDRRRPQLQPPAGGPIRLAHNHQLIREVRHAGEQRDPEGAGAEERDPADPLVAH